MDDEKTYNEFVKTDGIATIVDVLTKDFAKLGLQLIKTFTTEELNIINKSKKKKNISTTSSSSLPIATQIKECSVFPNEEEWLLNAGAFLRVVSEYTCFIPPFVRAKEYLHPTRFVHMEVLQSSTYLPNIPRNIKRQTQTTDGFEHFLKTNGFDVLQKYHHTPIYKKVLHIVLLWHIP